MSAPSFPCPCLLAGLVSICVGSSAAAAQTSPAPGADITAVYIVSRPGDDAPTAPAGLGPTRARIDAGVTLYAVLELSHRGQRRFYSDAGRIRVRGRVITPRPMTDAPAVALRWYKVEPTVETLSNTATGSFRFETIPYAETEVEAWRDHTSVSADVHPTLTTDRGQGVGTMRYMLAAVTPSGQVTSPGIGARASRGGGLSERVHRVSLRRDDTYLGMLTELYGQPYIWASGGQPAARHQSERLEGADCADFVVYGWRRLGHRIPYTWSEGLREHTRRVAAGAPGNDGVYRDDHGRALDFPAPGDLLLFPGHVGVLVADRGQPGVLDGDDIMAHTLFASPREQSIAAAGYAGRSVEVLRWRGRRRPPRPRPAGAEPGPDQVSQVRAGRVQRARRLAR